MTSALQGPEELGPQRVSRDLIALGHRQSVTTDTPSPTRNASPTTSLLDVTFFFFFFFFFFPLDFSSLCVYANWSDENLPRITSVNLVW
jgi:hypothetical protein